MEFSYCPRCGSELSTKVHNERERLYCPGCDEIVYRNSKPVGAVAVVSDEGVLLIKRGHPPDEGMWSLPAGFLEYDEPPREGATRELEEETSVEVEPEELELFDTVFTEDAEGEKVLVVVYRVEAEGEPVAGDDASRARFWGRGEVEKSIEKIRPDYRDTIREAF